MATVAAVCLFELFVGQNPLVHSGGSSLQDVLQQLFPSRLAICSDVGDEGPFMAFVVHCAWQTQGLTPRFLPVFILCSALRGSSCRVLSYMVGFHVNHMALVRVTWLFLVLCCISALHGAFQSSYRPKRNTSPLGFSFKLSKISRSFFRSMQMEYEVDNLGDFFFRIISN
eukprot:Gb_38169 [translate_table: standard]